MDPLYADLQARNQVKDEFLHTFIGDTEQNVHQLERRNRELADKYHSGMSHTMKVHDDVTFKLESLMDLERDGAKGNRSQREAVL